MKLLEYEAKDLLRRYGLATPAGMVTRRAIDGPHRLPAVVKAQIPAGGRGKAGGVRVAQTAEELNAAIGTLLGTQLLGHVVGSVLVEEFVAPARELYLAVVLDRSKGRLALLAHGSGGVDINEAAADGPVLRLGLMGRPGKRVTERVRTYLGLDEAAADGLEAVIVGLWELAVAEEALLAEVNPLVLTADGRLVCADAKLELDDAAAFRHAGWAFEASPASAQFVVLSESGTVASVANGAGLAMATNDAIAAAGAEPANFYDVGGGSDTAAMTAGFDRIRGLPKVRAVVVNIFGGITRCDEVAAAILAARAADPRTPPVFVRLAGTNAAEGRRMLAAVGLELAGSLDECVRLAVAEVQRV